MHIAEGIVSLPILISGVALATVGTAIGLKKLDYNKVAQVGIFTAVFFVAGLVHIPIGPSNAHFVLNGIVGILLGWVAFPALLVGTLLQAIFFQFGGLTTLGINTVNLAIPALIVHYLYLFSPTSFLKSKALIPFLCGFLAVGVSALGVSLSLALTADHFVEIAFLIFVSHLPMMCIEGFVTASCIVFLLKVEPSLLPKRKPLPIFKTNPFGINLYKKKV